VFNQLSGLAELLKNSGKNSGKLREGMERASEVLGQIQTEGCSGGGSVTAKANGRQELLSVRIDPKLVSDGDVELLEDLVAAAVNQAMSKSREAVAQHFSNLTGGLPLGGLSHLFGGNKGAGGEQTPGS
jgi:DNA-binding YbaB/EbfC family protein